MVQRSVDPEANIIFGTVIDESLEDELLITVIATGFADEEPRQSFSRMGVDQIVSKAWEQKINPIPSSAESLGGNAQDLDIPSFLRKNKGLNK